MANNMASNSRRTKDSPLRRHREIDRLRARIAEIERRTPVLADPLGDWRRDAPMAAAGDNPGAYWGSAFGARGVLHEVRFASLGRAQCDDGGTPDHRAAAAALSFAIALSAGAEPARAAPRVFIERIHEAAGEGAIHAPGLAPLGVAAGRCLFVRARSDREALWAAEEALRATGEGGRFSVIALLRQPGREVNLKATRRLHLAAEGTGAQCVLVRGGAGEPSCAPYRWRVGPQPSRPMADDPRGPGLPAVLVALEKGGAVRPAVTLEMNRSGARLQAEHTYKDEVATGSFHPVPLAVAGGQ
ncbi:MAG: hypothetical protein GC152_10920 [Alphaproteobacteria bacterium]|nr:hypothetical protein [Alphaproteobacteria bacterium]